MLQLGLDLFIYINPQHGRCISRVLEKLNPIGSLSKPDPTDSCGCLFHCIKTNQVWQTFVGRSTGIQVNTIIPYLYKLRSVERERWSLWFPLGGFRLGSGSRLARRQLERVPRSPPWWSDSSARGFRPTPVDVVFTSGVVKWGEEG